MGFKGLAIKNDIGYEQERDRQRIHACPPNLQRRREANVKSNEPSIDFGQVTDMLKEIEQTHREVLSNMDSYRIRRTFMDSSFSASHFQLESLKQQLNQLNEQLKESSRRLSKFRRSSLWQRYWTAIVVGVISALLTNLIWWISL